MVADLAELHDEIHEVLHLLFTFSKLEEIVRRNLVFNALIENSLSVCHVTDQLDLSLLTDLLLNITLQSTKHEWLENCMQSFELMLVELSLVHR